jgi:hypothetical protein
MRRCSIFAGVSVDQSIRCGHDNISPYRRIYAALDSYYNRSFYQTHVHRTGQHLVSW